MAASYERRVKSAGTAVHSSGSFVTPDGQQERRLIVGVKIGPALNASVRRAAEEAERVGFHSVWLSERVVTPLDKPHPYDPMPDPWVALSYLAAGAERVPLGTSVRMTALRAPVLLARRLVTVDRP